MIGRHAHDAVATEPQVGRGERDQGPLTPRQFYRAWIRDLVVGILIPLAVTQVLRHYGVSLAWMLAFVVVYAGVVAAVRWRATHRFNRSIITGVVVLCLSLALQAETSDPKILGYRFAAITALTGIIVLLSLRLPRPFIYSLVKPFVVRGNVQRLRWLQERWQDAEFRRTFRMVTAVWGVGLWVESALAILAVTAIQTDHPVLLARMPAVILNVGMLGWSLIQLRRILDTGGTQFATL